jgi:cytochrome P450
MMDLFSETVRRNPYPAYQGMRSSSPILPEPKSGLWMLFDYESVNRALTDHEAFSSRHGPVEWMIFLDPPRHSKLRGLVSHAFTPLSIAKLEPRIRELSREFLDATIERGELDVANDFAAPLPMAVIAEMLGIPTADRRLFTKWNDAILNMSYTVPAAGAAALDGVVNDFRAATAEMDEYLGGLLSDRRASPRPDLLTRLLQAHLDSERLTQAEILGFFQLLLLAGSETTTNLINNSILCFIECPDQLARLRAAPELLPSAIEEVLRYRSPLQWMFRVTRRDVQMHGQTIPAGKVTLVMLGSANRDPKQFPDADRFDITRNPNPHLAFGHGIHFCLGAALARLEARVALTELLSRIGEFNLASDLPWEPRKGLHVHGPTSLPLRFTPSASRRTRHDVLPP